MASRHRAHTAPRRTDTQDPARSRERALRILFQADLRGVDPSVTLARVESDPAARALLDEHDGPVDDEPILPAPDRAVPDDPTGDAAPLRPGASGWTEVAAAEADAIDGFTRSLVLGVERDRAEVEALISRYARRWAISRMPVVDRNVLRLATYELLYESTPAAVVLNEAIGLAKRLSTDDSGRFVNGVLESIRQEVARTREQPPTAEDGAG